MADPISLSVVQPPQTVDTTHTTGAQTNTTSVVQTPEVKADFAAIKQSNDQQLRGAADVEFEKQNQAAVAQFNAEKIAEQKAKQEAEQRQAYEAQQQKVNDAMAAEQAARQKMLDSANVHTFWDKGSPGLVLATFISGIGDYARAAAGQSGPSLASQELDNQLKIDGDWKIQQYKKSEAYHNLAAEGVVAARNGMADFLKNLDHMQAVQRDTMAAQAEANAARFKTPQAAADAAEFRAQQASKIAETDAKIRESWATKVTHEGARSDETHVENDKNKTGKEQKPSEGENKYAQYGAQMDDALKSLATLKPLTPEERAQLQAIKTDYDAAEKTASSGILGAKAVKFGRWMEWIPKSKIDGLSPNAQSVVSAHDNFVNGALRTESGAAIGEVELSRRFNELLPAAGDSEQVLAQKAERMDKMRTDFLSLGGQATKKLQEGRAAAAPKPEEKKAAPADKGDSVHSQMADTAKWLQEHPNASKAERKAALDLLGELAKEL